MSTIQQREWQGSDMGGMTGGVKGGVKGGIKMGRSLYLKGSEPSDGRDEHISINIRQAVNADQET